MQQTVNIFWFRRDLRLQDNTALYHALTDNNPVVPVFIFDREILDKLEDATDQRVEFIHSAVEGIQAQLRGLSSSLEVYHGFPRDIFSRLLSKYKIEKLYFNHDYEPYSLERDNLIMDLFRGAGIKTLSFKDHVLFEKNEIVKEDGKPYTVFTPYSKRWKLKVKELKLDPGPVEKYLANFYKQDPQSVPSLQSIGFRPAGKLFPPKNPDNRQISAYKEQRDIPGIDGTTKMGVHLRFGTISPRLLVKKALELSETYLNELIWRDFYQAILWHFPAVGKGRSFKREYDFIIWRNDEAEFERWCRGQTGYPLVDAGMRELNATGFMHNRVRMVTASFLSKHLLVDWRWGEAYFAKKLLDFDLGSNNGGWQWAAGCGCDAAPYFRIFNPYLQAKKFDPDLRYIRKWIPELEEPGYPQPVIEHTFARKRVLEAYARALKK